MHVTNEVQPGDPERIKRLMEPGPDGPIFMVNLLKFKDKAQYEDGRETDLTGRQAYALYGQAVADIIKDYGGRIAFMADVTFLALGQADEMWDEVAIARYPKRGDMVRMSMSPEWQAAAVHRTAGLEGQLNIETVIPELAKDSDWAKALLA